MRNLSISTILDFKRAEDKDKSKDGKEMPLHKNVIRNYANVEIFYNDGSKQEDCVGWITIMEKAGDDLRKVLKNGTIQIGERKKIAGEILDGLNYLWKNGIKHCDRKLENILLENGEPKIIDFGLVFETTGKSGYRQMGYARCGSNYRYNPALCKLI